MEGENKNKHLHGGHRGRLRKRYRKEGLDNFEQHEILELLLQYSVYQRDTNPLAHLLLNSIGSLSDVLDADAEDLMSVPGIGERSAVFLKLVRAMGEQYAIDLSEKKEVFDTAEKAVSYCVQQYVGITEERFSVMLFDCNLNLIAFEELGDLSWYNPSGMMSRVAEFVFRYSAAHFAIIRNAPNGIVTPTEFDMSESVNLFRMFKTLGRNMLEYFIISEDSYMPVLKYTRKTRGTNYGSNIW